MSFAVCVCVCVCVKCDVYNSALPLLRINLSRWLKSKSSSQILFGCRISFEMKTISIDALYTDAQVDGLCYKNFFY